MSSYSRNTLRKEQPVSVEIVEIERADFGVIWPVLEPVIRQGETYPHPRDMDINAARAMWAEPGRRVFAAMEGERCIGTYYIRPNQIGAGAHVANAGYAVAPHARGRGLGKAMCQDSIEMAREAGYRAMQFNLVVSVNESAVRAWKACGFRILTTLPEAFKHPRLGFVDAYIMHRPLV